MQVRSFAWNAGGSVWALWRLTRERLDMKLASCDNCAYRKENTCALGLAPKAGEFLCPKYAMSQAFHDEVLALARKEFQKDVDQAFLQISVIRAEKDKAFAG